MGTSKSWFFIISIAILIIVACVLPDHLGQIFSEFQLFGADGEYSNLPKKDPNDSGDISLTADALTPELKPTSTLESYLIPTASIEKPVASTITREPIEKIIYTCQVDKNPSHDQICMIYPDGSGFRQLTDDLSVQHFYPSWAPDGRNFVFSAAYTGQFKIYEMDLSGKLNKVGEVSGELYAPMISPDGSKIVFTRHFSESEQYISVMNRDGSNVKNLTGYYDAKDPVWSPDGLKILFTSMHSGTPQIYFMNADGSLIHKISELKGLRGRTDWSIDLSFATYAGEKEEHNREIVLLELGGEPKYLTDGGDNLSPSFSPDGLWLVFMSYRDHFWQADGCELYIMRRDGSDIRRLTDNGYCDYQPRWGN